MKILISVLCMSVIFVNFSYSSVRIKDIASVEGARDNQLFGYGLVVGLNGTGDDTDMTKQSVVNLLKKMGIELNLQDINTDNIAAVIVTANIPPFIKPGERIDVQVSSIGDADSLQGGTLLQTPLQGADGRVYAVAQGAVSIGGFEVGRQAARLQKGFPTVARIPNGAIVEEEIPVNMVEKGVLRINLNYPDFTTSLRVSDVINKKWKSNISLPVDSSTVKIDVPPEYTRNIVKFISEIESLTVEPDKVSKVVINERTGTIVFGGDITISPVSIAHGGLTIKIKPTYKVVQPEPFSNGQTAILPGTQLEVTEKEVMIHKVPTTQDVVEVLNFLGVKSTDIIAILQALKASGALLADIEIL